MPLSCRLLLVPMAGLLGLLSAACSVEKTLPVPHCEQGESALIVAQSVPTADLIPCFNPLPVGWEVDAVTINQDGTVIRFDSDRAGVGAANLYYAETCDLGDAVTVPSEQDGAEAFEYIEQIGPGFRAERYYLFPGGCVWWEFEFDADASATHSIEVQDRLMLVTRKFLNENIRQTFIDEQL